MTLPYDPDSDYGRGFLPLIVRSLAHALFVAGANFNEWPMTVEQARANLAEGLEHANSIQDTDLLSEGGKAALTDWKGSTQLLLEAFRVAEGRDPEQVIAEHKRAIVSYTQQCFALLAVLDRELLGYTETETDAGKLP